VPDGPLPDGPLPDGPPSGRAAQDVAPPDGPAPESPAPPVPDSSPVPDSTPDPDESAARRLVRPPYRLIAVYLLVALGPLVASAAGLAAWLAVQQHRLSELTSRLTASATGRITSVDEGRVQVEWTDREHLTGETWFAVDDGYHSVGDEFPILYDAADPNDASTTVPADGYQAISPLDEDIWYVVIGAGLVAAVLPALIGWAVRGWRWTAGARAVRRNTDERRAVRVVPYTADRYRLRTSSWLSMPTQAGMHVFRDPPSSGDRTLLRVMWHPAWHRIRPETPATLHCVTSPRKRGLTVYAVELPDGTLLLPAGSLTREVRPLSWRIRPRAKAEAGPPRMLVLQTWPYTLVGALTSTVPFVAMFPRFDLVGALCVGLVGASIGWVGWAWRGANPDRRLT